MLLTTVTRSDTGGGVTPAATVPNVTVERSSESERTGWMSTSTAAPAEAVGVDGSGGGVVVQGCAAAAELRGDGNNAVKSAALTFVSAQPPSPRVAAVVLVSAGAAPDPS